MDSALTCKEVGALTKVIGENERYFMTREDVESMSSAAFSIYDMNHCCEEPVLRIMESQIPPKCYKGFVGLANSADNHERAESSGMIKPEDENEYLSKNTHDFD